MRKFIGFLLIALFAISMVGVPLNTEAKSNRSGVSRSVEKSRKAQKKAKRVKAKKARKGKGKLCKFMGNVIADRATMKGVH